MSGGEIAQQKRAKRNEARAIPRTDGRGYRAAYYDLLGHRRWVTAATAEQAESRRAERLALQAKGIAGLPADETAYQLLCRWIDKVQPGTRTKRSRAGIKHAHWRRNQGIVHNHIGRYLDRVPVLELTTTHVEGMINGLEAERTLSARSIELVWTTLVTGLNWAVSQELIPVEIELRARRAMPPAVNRGADVPPFSARRTKALLDAIANHRLRSLFEIAATVGPRQGELLAARWSDVDWDSRRLWISSTLAWPEGIPTAERNKGNRRRHVPLTPNAFKALQAWRERQAAERREHLKRAGASWANDKHDFIWTSPNGNPARGTGTGGVTSQLKTALRHAGFADANDWTFYTLRHHAASWLLAATNGNMFVVMRLLGQTSTAQLEQTYGHLLEHVPEATMRAAEELLHGTLGDNTMFDPTQDSPRDSGRGLRLLPPPDSAD